MTFLTVPTQEPPRGQLDYTLIALREQWEGWSLWGSTIHKQLPVNIHNHAPNTSNKIVKRGATFVRQNFQELCERLDSSPTPKFPGSGRNSWTHLLLQKFPGNGRHNWTHLLPQNFQEMGETVADHIRNPRDLINNYSPKKDDQIDQKITIYR